MFTLFEMGCFAATLSIIALYLGRRAGYAEGFKNGALGVLHAQAKGISIRMEGGLIVVKGIVKESEVP